MRVLDLKNPFGAPIYHEEIVSSTMDTARVLAGKNEPHGTVIAVDFQEAGRGRLKRSWTTEKGKNLLFTILLRYSDISSIPEALTLKTGLAVSLAIEDCVPALTGTVQVKWPNDIMVGSRKLAGILTEGDGKNVYIGVGVNVSQREFPGEYQSKAGSIIQAIPGLGENARFALLEHILSRLYEEIEAPQKTCASQETDAAQYPGLWRERLLERLYKKGELVTFAEGSADSKSLTEGTLSGLGPGGELLIIPRGEKTGKAFITGELLVY